MDYFLLDAKTGALTTAKPVDKEALPDATGLVELTVRVSFIVKKTSFTFRWINGYFFCCF